MRIERDVALARLTTIGTGGPARFLARPETLDELREALAFAREEGVSVATVGVQPRSPPGLTSASASTTSFPVTPSIACSRAA